MTSVVTLVLGVLVVAATSPTEESARARTDIGPLAVGAAAAAVEVPIEVITDGTPDDWSEREVRVAVTASDGTPLLVEVLDGRGDRLAAAAGAEGSATTVELVQRCGRQDCGTALRIRVRSLGDPASQVEVGGEVAVKARAGEEDVLGAMSLEVGGPEAIDAAALDERAALGPRSVLTLEPDATVAGQRVVLPDLDCDADDPWIVVLPPSTTTLATVRVITAGGDTHLYGGEAAPVWTCTNGISSAWVVTTAPPGDRTTTIEWAVLGGVAVLDAEVTDAAVSSTVTETVRVGSSSTTLDPVPLPAGGAALHLARAVVDEAAAEPDSVDVRVDGGEWTGDADPFAPVVAGPCPPVDCSPTLELAIRLAPSSPQDPTVDAHAEVLHLVAPA